MATNDKKKSFEFVADKVDVESVPGGYILRGVKQGDGTPKNPWREDTIIAANWAEVGDLMKEWLDVKTSIL
jgi:hypothetical protein